MIIDQIVGLLNYSDFSISLWSPWLVSRFVLIFLISGLDEQFLSNFPVSIQANKFSFSTNLFISFFSVNLSCGFKIITKFYSDIAQFRNECLKCLNGGCFSVILIFLPLNNSFPNGFKLLDDHFNLYNIKFSCHFNEKCNWMIIS